jgi:hypothetical protein
MMVSAELGRFWRAFGQRQGMMAASPWSDHAMIELRDAELSCAVATSVVTQPAKRPLDAAMLSRERRWQTGSIGQSMLSKEMPRGGPMSKNARALKTRLAWLAVLAPIVAATVGPSTRSAAADAGLDVLTGSWQGGGTMSFESGTIESISCNGYYKGAGNLSVVIRCRGSSSNFELRSKLEPNGDKISGSWEERTYNATGAVSGTASAGKLNVQFSGSLTGSLEMTFSSSSQSVSVSVDTKGAGIKGVRVSLNRM